MNNIIVKELYRTALLSKISFKKASEINTFIDNNSDFLDVKKIMSKHEVCFIENDVLKCYIIKYCNTIYISFSSILSYNVDSQLHHFKDNICIHKGLFHHFQNLKEQLIDHITDLDNLNNVKKIYICGYKMGGALATVAASMLAEYYNNIYLVSCFTFGAQRVGNKQFTKYFNRYVIRSYRVNAVEYGNGSTIYEDISTSSKYKHVSNSILLDKDNIMEIQEAEVSHNVISKMLNWQYTEQHRCESLETFIEYFKNILFAFHTNLESKLSSDNIAKMGDDDQIIYSAASSISNNSTIPSPPAHPNASPPINKLSDDMTTIILEKLESINLLVSKIIEQNSSNLVLNEQDREEHQD